MNSEENNEKADFGDEVTEENVAIVRGKDGRFRSATDDEIKEELGKDPKPDEKPDDKKDDDKGDDKKDDDKGDEKKDDEKPDEKDDEKPDEKDDEKDDEAEDDPDKKPGGRLNKRVTKLVSERNDLAAQNQLLRAQVAELARSEAKDAKAEKTEIDKLGESLDALYEEVEKARVDADVKLAAKLQREIDATNRKISALETEHIAARTSSAVNNDTMYNNMLDYMEREIPQMNPNTDEFDPNLVKNMEFQVAAHMRMDMSAPEALRRAAHLLLGGDVFTAKKAKAANGKEKLPDKKPDVKKNMDAAKKAVPGGATNATNAEGKMPNTAQLTDKEFDALPESKRAQLRGDFFTGA